MLRVTLTAALILLAAPAIASPPPIPLSILVVSPEQAPPGRIAASERLIETLYADGWYGRAVAPLGNSGIDFSACSGEGAVVEYCIRKTVADSAATWTGKPPVVVVAVGPGPGSSVTWTCIGAGGAFKRPERQRVVFDPDVALSTVRDAARREAYDHAVGCIMAAGSESGW